MVERLPPPQDYIRNNPLQHLENFCPPLPHQPNAAYFKNMPLCYCCGPTTVTIHVVQLSRTKSQTMHWKPHPTPPPQSMLKSPLPLAIYNVHSKSYMYLCRGGYCGWRRIAIQYDTARAYCNTYCNILGILCTVIFRLPKLMLCLFGARISFMMFKNCIIKSWVYDHLMMTFAYSHWVTVGVQFIYFFLRFLDYSVYTNGFVGSNDLTDHSMR